MAHLPGTSSSSRQPPPYPSMEPVLDQLDDFLGYLSERHNLNERIVRRAYATRLQNGHAALASEPDRPNRCAVVVANGGGHSTGGPSQFEIHYRLQQQQLQRQQFQRKLQKQQQARQRIQLAQQAAAVVKLQPPPDEEMPSTERAEGTTIADSALTSAPSTIVDDVFNAIQVAQSNSTVAPSEVGQQYEEQPQAATSPTANCRYCGKYFRASGARLRHERLHSGERPYPCTYCDKRFSRSDVRKGHWRTCGNARVENCGEAATGVSANHEAQGEEDLTALPPNATQ